MAKKKAEPVEEPQPRVEPPHRTFSAWLWDWTKSIAIALVVWLVLRTFLIEAFRIPSGSMENTLLVGDFLFVNKALYGAEVPFTGKHLPAIREPKRGDILVFDSVEQEGMKIVKRLIGMPGDTLSMENGELYINGKKMEEPYAVKSDPAKSEDPFQRGRVPTGGPQLQLGVSRRPQPHEVVVAARKDVHTSQRLRMAAVEPFGEPHHGGQRPDRAAQRALQQRIALV